MLKFKNSSALVTLNVIKVPAARVATLRILEDLLSKGDVFICLPLYRLLPSFFLLSLLLLSCLTYSDVGVSKGRLLGPAMRGLCGATEINAPPENDLSYSRPPGGLQAHPGSY